MFNQIETSIIRVPTEHTHLLLLANTLVSSRLDYCNLLFVSLLYFELRIFECIPNSLYRVVIHSSRFSHITPNWQNLHRVLVNPRVQFKIGLITYKILKYGQPAYLTELIHPYMSSRNTRSSSPRFKFLHIPTFNRIVHKSQKHFSNSFSHHTPALWNSFLFQIRDNPSVISFRKHLETHLFNSSFHTFLINIFVTWCTQLPIVGQILRLQSIRLD